VPGSDDQDQGQSPPVAPAKPPVWRSLLAGAPGAVLAFATGLVALLFTLFPSLKPFEATELSANIRVVDVDRAVTRDQWRHRIAEGDPVRYEEIVAEERKTSKFKDKCGRGAEPGFVLYVETDAKGFKRRELLVRAAIYDADTRRRVEGVDEEFRVLASLPIDAPTARSVQQIWLWEPGVSRRYLARVQIYDRSDHLLAFDDSKVFRGLNSEELRALPSTCVRDR
jgi:hypothetical protein